MIRKARYFLAAAGTTAILVGGMTLAGAGAASAATLPSCANGVNCTSSGAGVAGYYGADDNHTHYRYVGTVTVATQQLVFLNGNADNTGGKADQGSVGVTLCDPNSGQVAQLSLGWNGAALQVVYATGHFLTSAAEPCVQSATPVMNIFHTGTLLMASGISFGDQVSLSISYNPAGHHHTIQFSACDLTSKVCRQSGNLFVFAKEYWEFGIGAFTPIQKLTAPANNPLTAFGSNQVACYSCGGAVPITSVSPVNPFNIGGLYEARLVNISSQITMSPNDSLATATDQFGIQSGSTSS